MKSDRRRAKIESVLSHRQPDLTIVAEDIHDPHNVSAMLRTADAVGIHEVQLLYVKEKFPKIGKKSSSSAEKWIDRRKFDSVEACYAKLREEGYHILVTRLDSNARSLYDFDLTQKTAIVFGNEHGGVSEEAASQADGMIAIPMMGMIQSLNVSVACAVVLYEALRQRMLAGRYVSAGFEEEAMRDLLRDWMKK